MTDTPLVLTCAGRRIGVGTEQFSIGRSRDNDLPLRSPKVSRRHCRVERRDDGFYMVDQGSATGIELRGVKVNDYKIEEGDIFVLAEDISVRCSMGPSPLSELHTPDLRVILLDLGNLTVGASASDLRSREPLSFEVRGVQLAGPKGAAVLWRDERGGRSGLARASESYSWSTSAFPLLRADAAPDGITVRLMPLRTAEPVTLFESPHPEESTWRNVQDLVYMVSRLFPAGARTGDEIDRAMTLSRQ